MQNEWLLNPIQVGRGSIRPPPSNICFKIGLMGSGGPHTHWLFLKMHEKWFPNVFLGRTPPGGPRRTYFYLLPPPKKTLKSTVFELEWWFLHVNRSVFHQELNWKGPRVPGGHYFTKKWQIYYPNFQHPKIPKKLDLGFDMSLTHDMTFLAFVWS